MLGDAMLGLLFLENILSGRKFWTYGANIGSRRLFKCTVDDIFQKQMPRGKFLGPTPMFQVSGSVVIGSHEDANTLGYINFPFLGKFQTETEYM
jgi:hypothetical protein